MNRRALIIGITGQDGAYLSRFLFERGYDVHGLIRSKQAALSENLASLAGRLQLHEGNVVDDASLYRVIGDVRPHEVYNLAARSFIPASFSQPLLTAETNALGVTRLLEAIRLIDPTIRYFQASTSEMFGSATESPQNEQTSFFPRNPYGVAKLYGHWMTVNFRQTHGMFACSGILFNHESPLREQQFVTRRISYGVARIAHGLDRTLRLGSLNARRDWGFAGDYVRAMWLMLQQDHATDFVIATGQQHSVREFAALAFDRVGLDWQRHVESDDALIRSTDVDTLCGDASKAQRELQWQPTVSFEELVAMMVDHDMDLVSRERVLCKQRSTLG